MKLLSAKILKAELEDFELDKSSDYSDSLMARLRAFFQVFPSHPLTSPRASTTALPRICCWAYTRCVSPVALD